MHSEQELIIRIETPIPARIVTGAGTAFYLAGSCFHTAQPIRIVEILFDGRAQSDVSGQTCSSADSNSQNLLNSFWAIIQVQPAAASTSVDLSVRATLFNGEIIQQRIAVLNLAPFETEVAPL
ncbi:MAG: hypothetical protein M3X11_17770, partial [Acidobacteriota bacterium]|nr:hypothetical protein [Acidobacteriota bacterium]